MVAAARQTQLSYVEDKDVWMKVTRKEAVRRGLRIIGVRWIGVNREETPGGTQTIEVGARRRRIQPWGKETSVSSQPIPLLEALRLIISEAATCEGERDEGNKVIMINDIARAFFEATSYC